MKGVLFGFLVAALLAGGQGFLFGTEAPGTDGGNSWMARLRSVGTALRDMLRPHLEDLSETVTDMRRQMEDSGGVDGLRLDAERAMEEIQRHGGRATERTRGFLSKVLDNLEAKIDDASGMVRYGLTSLVRNGRRVLQRTVIHPLQSSTTINPEEWISIDRVKRRARREARPDPSVVPGQAQQVYPKTTDNLAIGDLRPHLEEYNRQFRDITNLLRDIRYELHNLRRGFEDQSRPYHARESDDHSGTLRELEAIIRGGHRNKRQLGSGDTRRGNQDDMKLADVRDYLSQYKEGFSDISSLLKDIRYELNIIRSKIQ